MDRARLNSETSMDDVGAGTTTVHAEVTPPNGNTSVTHTAMTSAVTQRVRDHHVAQIPANASGTIAMPRPGTFDLPAEEGYQREHALAARVVKRVFDLVAAIVLIAVLAPTWLLIAFLIKVDSPGPILFRQRRVGRDGQVFRMLKFRTMVDGADAHKPALLHLNQAADGLFKINGDPRVTRFGQWLRATSLDELPQLLHVATGRMSLVGPRPLVPEEDARIVGSQRRRLQMRPGMTGIWQVRGASAIPIREMIKLDSDYVDDWSLWTDLKLLASTAGHVLLRRGL
jgi:lipopolysaccharide/colanic/teichoic acid biosynthesis glycosyltransferase